MVSELTIPLEDVVRPEFVTYMQAAKMIGVRHDTVRVYQTRSRALEAKGNPSGVPLFPKPMRIEGFRGTAVFYRAEIEAYIAAQQNREPKSPGRPARNTVGRLDWDASRKVSALAQAQLTKKSMSAFEAARSIGVGGGPFRSRLLGEVRWRDEEVQALEKLLGVKLLKKPRTARGTSAP